MKKLVASTLFVLLTALCFSANVLVKFSPNGGCTDEIIKQIKAAKETILVQAYSFTSAPIVDALLEAHKAGVKVRIVVDKSQLNGNGSKVRKVKEAGITEFRVDKVHAIAHNKIMVIDDKVIITGSFNFTESAELRNAENLLVITEDKDLVEKYKANFEEHCKHSVVIQ